MSPAAFIDANIPIYAAGRGSPYKAPCARCMIEHPLRHRRRRAVHRYVASGRWALGREVLRAFAEVMHDRIEPVYAAGWRELGGPPSGDKRPRPPACGRDAAHGHRGSSPWIPTSTACRA